MLIENGLKGHRVDSLPDYMTSTRGALHSAFGGLVQVLDWISAVIVAVAIALMLIGVARFIYGFVLAEVDRDSIARVQGLNRERVELGRYILAGLELLIVSDIIHTAITLALGDLLFLGLLVLIRSLISFSLDREIKEINEELERGR